jgi:hypothetical protein
MSDFCKPTSSIRVPDPPGYCCDIKLAKCVFYNGPDLCIDVTQNSFLHDLLEEISTVLCNPDIDVSNYSYQKLAVYNIETERDFVNAVVNVITQIVGLEDVNNITSVTDLEVLLNTLQTTINEFNSIPVSECFEPLSGLSGNVTLAQIVQAIQQALCNLDNLVLNIDDKFVKVSPTDTTSGYLNSKITAGTNATLTILGLGGNERIQLSAVSVSGGGLNAVDSQSVNVTISGGNLKTVSGDVRLSSNIQNLLKASGAGLYVSVQDLIDQIQSNNSYKQALCDLCT